MSKLTITERICANCRHRKHGECHRMPPTPAIGEDGDTFAIRPPVDDWQTCGEFKASLAGCTRCGGDCGHICDEQLKRLKDIEAQIQAKFKDFTQSRKT